MKMLLVAAKGGDAIPLGYHLKPLGFIVEHVRDPVAVDLQHPIHARLRRLHGREYVVFGQEPVPKRVLSLRLLLLVLPGDLPLHIANAL